jgi:hypothetical protein
VITIILNEANFDLVWLSMEGIHWNHFRSFWNTYFIFSIYLFHKVFPVLLPQQEIMISFCVCHLPWTPPDQWSCFSNCSIPTSSTFPLFHCYIQVIKILEQNSSQSPASSVLPRIDTLKNLGMKSQQGMDQ